MSTSATQGGHNNLFDDFIPISVIRSPLW